jgi:phosphatidylinositol-3-phosphatase
VLIILENGSPDEAKSQLFMIDRANEGMVLDKYFAVAHPSQPNYIALVSGSLAGTNGDSTPTLHRDHLGMRIRGAGRFMRRITRIK